MTKILSDKLRSFDYYKSKIPQYLQNSHGFVEHFRIWYDAMMGDDSISINGIVPSCEELLSMLNIFDFSLDIPSDILDKIGSIFGVTRRFTVSYQLNDSTISKQLNLSDTNFRYLILSRVIRNACEGTREQIEALYKSIGLNVRLITSSDLPATCSMYLVYFSDTTESYDEELVALFLSGNLRISSMGIKYEESAVNVDNLLVWDSSSAKAAWDTGVWL